jgi:hypothetical protein
MRVVVRLLLPPNMKASIACITNIMGHNLPIIVVWNLLFIGSYGINMDVIHLLTLYEHQCLAHCLNINVMCLFVLFRHRCCMSIHVVYTWKLCTQLPCLNNAWHSCLNNMNLWNNKSRTNLEWTHEAYKFVMCAKQNKLFSNDFGTYNGNARHVYK